MLHCLRTTARVVARRLSATMLSALAACVGVGGEEPPLGDVPFATHLSAPTRGEPFTTQDGYVITVERFAMLLNVNDEHLAVGRGEEPALLRAVRDGSTLLVRLPADDERPRADWESWGHLDARDRAGLEGSGMVSPPESRPTRPTVLVALRAAGHGRALRLDLALAPYSLGSMSCVPRAGGVPGVDVRAEALFSVAGVPRFASFARADTDGDGFISERELAEGAIDDAEAADAHAMVASASLAASRRGCERELGPFAGPLARYLEARPTYSQNLRDLLLVRAQRALIEPAQRTSVRHHGMRYP